MEQLIKLDKDLFSFLNNLYTPWLDQCMYYMTNTYFWIPLHVALLYLIVKVYGKRSWIIILGLILVIVATDQVTTGLMKPYFLRLRPTHDPELQDIVHTVNNYKGGLYGFASSHAANTFGVAMFLWLLLKPKYPWVVFLFLWATLVTYTRIYLGVHFPGDIVVGGLIGIGFGWMGTLLVNSMLRKFRARV